MTCWTLTTTKKTMDAGVAPQTTEERRARDGSRESDLGDTRIRSTQMSQISRDLLVVKSRLRRRAGVIDEVDADAIQVIVLTVQVDLALLKISRVTMIEVTVTLSLKDANEDSAEESVRSVDARTISAKLQDVRSQAVVEMMTTVIRMMAMIEVIREEIDDKRVSCLNRSLKKSSAKG